MPLLLFVPVPPLSLTQNFKAGKNLDAQHPRMEKPWLLFQYCALLDPSQQAILSLVWQKKSERGLLLFWMGIDWPHRIPTCQTCPLEPPTTAHFAWKKKRKHRREETPASDFVSCPKKSPTIPSDTVTVALPGKFLLLLCRIPSLSEVFIKCTNF